jgi:Fe-S cluster assembly protein SufD
MSSRSSAISKTILDDSALSEFYGEINISDFAENSDAKQNNSNIVLSDMAKAVDCPNLNVFNNNVKCSPGATVGAIDDHIMLYLMSRGIGIKTSKQLVIEGILL